MFNKMNRFFSIVITVAILIIALTACGSNSQEETADAQVEEETTGAQVEEETTDAQAEEETTDMPDEADEADIQSESEEDLQSWIESLK